MADWELNYSDRETLRPKLVPRCVEAIRKYLLYLQGVGNAEQKAWATANMPNLQSLGEQISHYCMSEPTFIAGGTSITDAALQSRVETVLNSFFIPSA